MAKQEQIARFTDEIGNPVVVQVDEHGYALLHPEVESLIEAIYDVVVAGKSPLEARLKRIQVLQEWGDQDG